MYLSTLFRMINIAKSLAALCCAVALISCGERVAETPAKEEAKPEVKAELTPQERFDSLLRVLPEISFPHKFKSELDEAVQKAKFPNGALGLTDYDSLWHVSGKILMNKDFPLVLLKRYDTEFNLYDTYWLVSFDSLGQHISHLPVVHSSDGQGRTFAITPENRIRVAVHEASKARIRTYEYVNGQFNEVGKIENRDADKLPDY
jgi:hypothetical protein